MQNLKVLIADDSVVFRKTLKQILSEVDHVEIVDSVMNGKLALKVLQNEKVDLVILDIEMPEMDGFETIKAMKENSINTKAIIFSSQSTGSIQKSLKTMDYGVVDVIMKPETSSFSAALESIKSSLIPRLEAFIRKNVSTHRHSKSRVAQNSRFISDVNAIPNIQRMEAIAVASSTGGPSALHEFFKQLEGLKIKIPIFVTQHMPPVFTAGLAERIGQITGIESKEGLENEVVGSKIYVAPGDWHMIIKEDNDGVKRIKLHQKGLRCGVRPAADNMFESIADLYRQRVLGFVLTGMGADGAEGSKAIKQNGGRIMIQDEESSVVWGMPGATHELGIVDWVGTPETCGLVAREHLQI